MDSAYLPYFVTEIFCIAYTVKIYIHLWLGMKNIREFAVQQRRILARVHGTKMSGRSRCGVFRGDTADRFFDH